MTETVSFRLNDQPVQLRVAPDRTLLWVLRTELGQAIPAGGLDMPGARERSAEEIVLEMRRNAAAQTKSRVWEGEAVPPEPAGRCSRSLHRPPLDLQEPVEAGDLVGGLHLALGAVLDLAAGVGLGALGGPPVGFASGADPCLSCTPCTR